MVKEDKREDADGKVGNGLGKNEAFKAKEVIEAVEHGQEQNQLAQ